MASPSSSFYINRELFVYSVELFNGVETLENFNAINLDVKHILRWVPEVRCRVAVKLVENGAENVRGRDTCAM